MVDNDRKAVLILASDTPPEVVHSHLSRFRRHRRIVLAFDRLPEWDETGEEFDYYHVAKPAHLHWNLKMLGPVDAIMDGWSGSGSTKLDRLRNLFFHLRDKGTYIIPWSAVSKEPETLAEHLHAVNIRLAGDQSVEKDVADREFFRAVSAMRIDRTEARLIKRGHHYLKLRDDEASRVLPHRSPILVDEPVRTKEGVLALPAPVQSFGASRQMRNLPEEVDYPALHLRHYRGKIGLVSNSLVFAENSILPDSFRHHLASGLRNVRLINVQQDWGRIRPQLVPKTTLKGSYYLVDSENSGHFGHLMTEVISRLWGWDRAKADDPDLKALFRIRFTNERDPNLERTIFRAYGIDESDIAWVDEPVWLNSAWAATPQFHNQVPHYVHPGILETWHRIRDGLPSVDVPTSEKLFVSRSAELRARRCTNRPEVESWFRDAGFRVIYPEQYSMPEQAHIFAHARVIAGFGGSAMFNAIFADRLEHLIVLNQEAYTARNEHLIAMVLGAKLTYLWNRPEVGHTGGVWSKDAYRSKWSFDFGRHQEALKTVLSTS